MHHKTNGKHLVIVINSCANYYVRAVPPLLETLVKANVPMDCLHVVVGDATAQIDETSDNGVTYHHRQWCNIDNNGLLWVTQERPSALSDAMWILYLHDTSLVDDNPTFWDAAYKVISDHETLFDCVRLHQPFSMGMGFYKVEWLLKPHVASYLNQLVNYDVNRKPAIKAGLHILEDTLFKFALQGHGRLATLPNVYQVVEREKRMYGSDVPRIVEYYAIPGIYKIKANWNADNLRTDL